jgi:hypothetical protein
MSRVDPWDSSSTDWRLSVDQFARETALILSVAVVWGDGASATSSSMGVTVIALGLALVYKVSMLALASVLSADLIRRTPNQSHTVREVTPACAAANLKNQPHPFHSPGVREKVSPPVAHKIQHE